MTAPIVGDDFCGIHGDVLSGVLSRRQFLQAGGALLVSIALPLSADAATENPASWPETIAPDLLDSWLGIRADGSIVASVGKIEAGMGIGTAFAQIVAEELDVPLDRITVQMGDTATTVDQRGTGSSNGIVQAGPALRKAAAEARQALLGLAAERLQVAAERLAVEAGEVSILGSPAQRLSYGELIGGKRFELKMSGKAKVKPASQYALVGKPVPRFDIPPKVTGRYQYLVDVKVPGMLHGRVIRPPQAGAKLLSVGKEKFPGLVQVVARGDFVGVICEREEQAIRAARELKVRWSTPAPMFAPSYDALYESLRQATPKVSKTAQNVGDVDLAFSRAERTIEAQYDYPFQSHASMGPGCAVADVKSNEATIWSGGQKPYPLRKAMADLLKLPLSQVRVIWRPGPGSYGMNDADDAAADAAFLSQVVARPVRVQYMRHDGIAWDPKGPPSTIHLSGGLDAKGDVIAFTYEARGYSGRVRPNGTEHAGDTLSGQLFGGLKAASSDVFQLSEESYRFANKRKRAHVIAWEKSLPTGLRTAHLRDPDGPQACFASESFIDELAALAGSDPVDFRLRYLSEPRDIEAVRAAAQAAGWERRASPKRNDADSKSGSLSGRGIAYAPRGGAVVATVAEVDVNMDSGELRVRRFVTAHDCGFVVNPLNLRGTIEANLIQSMSRAIHEAVMFEPTRVTSVDWASYPIVDITEIPDRIDIVMLNNRPEQKSAGAGEPSTRPTAAAIGNAIFDATGVRIRRVPFTASALKTAFVEAKRTGKG